MTGRRQKAKKVATEVDLVPKQTMRGVTIQHRPVNKDPQPNSGLPPSSTSLRPTKRARHTAIPIQPNNPLDQRQADVGSNSYVDLEPHQELHPDKPKKKSGKVRQHGLPIRDLILILT